MKTRINLLSIIYLLFLMLLLLSGSFYGALSDVVYCLAFIVPALIYTFLERRVEGDFAAPRLFTKKSALVLPIVFPTVLLIFLLSLLTSSLIALAFGKGGGVDVGDNFWEAFLRHAIITSVLEEILFRYIPIRLLSPISARAAIICSSLFFAMAHHSFFSFIYTFVAGVVFAFADIMCESILPSVFLHMINNTVSLLWIFYGESTIFAIWFYAVLAFLSIVSFVFIFIFGKEYAQTLERIRTSERVACTREMLLFSIPPILIAAAEIIRL